MGCDREPIGFKNPKRMPYQPMTVIAQLNFSQRAE